MSGISKKSFDKLEPYVQRRLAQKALAWFCVMESLNPYFIRNQEEVDTVKIILSKFRDEKEQ